MKSDRISLFNNPRSKLTYFYTPFVYIKHGGPFCKFLGPSVLASIFLKKQTLVYVYNLCFHLNRKSALCLYYFPKSLQGCTLTTSFEIHFSSLHKTAFNCIGLRASNKRNSRAVGLTLF